MERKGKQRKKENIEIEILKQFIFITGIFLFLKVIEKKGKTNEN